MDLFWRWSKEGREVIREEKDERRTAKLAENARHRDLLDRAAGISSARLVCHPDTWLFIRQKSPNESVFGAWNPPAKPDEDGLVRINLSGPNLVMLLTSMRGKLNGWHPDHVEAIADRVYAGVAQVVAGVDPDSKGGKPVPDIVIDDRMSNSDGGTA